MSREEGRVGVVDIQALCEAQMRKLRDYFVETSIAMEYIGRYI